MKWKLAGCCAAGITLGAALVFWYFVAYPHLFKALPIRAGAVNRLKAAGQKSTPWTLSPEACALEYEFEGWSQGGGDPPEARYVHAALHSASNSQAVVDVFDSSPDDSVEEVCNRITMQLQGNVWIPIKDEWAQRGRGHIGWTTEPCL